VAVYGCAGTAPAGGSLGAGGTSASTTASSTSGSATGRICALSGRPAAGGTGPLGALFLLLVALAVARRRRVCSAVTRARLRRYLLRMAKQDVASSKAMASPPRVRSSPSRHEQPDRCASFPAGWTGPPLSLVGEVGARSGRS